MILDVATALLSVACLAWAIGLGIWAFREVAK